MCLMRNHSVGESPNLGKHTVSIDLFTEDISLLGLARHLSFSISIKNDLGKIQSLTGLLAAVTAITIVISYSGWVMGANRLKDGSILDNDIRRGRTNCDISFLFYIQRSF